MSDQLRTDELVPGVWIEVHSPMGIPWQKVRSVRQADEGIVVPIYAISFSEHGLELLANGDRVFNVERSTPAAILAIQTGLALPPPS